MYIHCGIDIQQSTPEHLHALPDLPQAGTLHLPRRRRPLPGTMHSGICEARDMFSDVRLGSSLPYWTATICISGVVVRVPYESWARCDVSQPSHEFTGSFLPMFNDKVSRWLSASDMIFSAQATLGRKKDNAMSPRLTATF